MLLLCASSANAQFPQVLNALKTKCPATTAQTARQNAQTKATAKDINLSYVPCAYYTPSSTAGAASDYYFEVSSVSATNEDNTVIYSAEGWGISIDLYADASAKPYAFPEGTYTAYTPESDDEALPAMTFDARYTYARYYPQAGSDFLGYALTSNIEVEKSGDDYTIKTSTTRNGQAYDLTFKGKITFTSTVTESGSLPAIGKDIVVDQFTGGAAFYQGNLFQGNTGNMEINLYTTTFDAETGATTAPGYVVKLSLFNTLFGDSKAARVKAGTYTPSFKFTKNTFLPGTDVNYMGISMILGSYAQERDESGNLRYARITDGTCVVEENEDGTYTVNVDMLTADGYTVKGTYTGTFPVTDQSSDTPKSHLSTLQEDHELDLAQITKARCWKLANIEGDNHSPWGQYVVDIGSRSGLDQEVIDNGGDIFRMHFIGDASGSAMVPEGTYEVMEDHWEQNYQSMRLVPGYMWDGEYTSTFYLHFIPGRYLVMDGYAPAAEGNISAKHNADDTYTFVVDVIDDAGFRITGKWTGPVEIQGDTQGIAEAASGAAPEFTFLGNHTVVLGTPATRISVYAANGTLVRTVNGTNQVSLAGMPHGVYFVKAQGKQAVKVAL